jgi:NAD(P)-dependent dehydrogenase (short-subunit alcohol dehydrogenase family)
MASYNAVKAGLLAFTETVGHELAAYGVHAHAVCPSYFRTNLMDSLRGADEAVGAVMRQLVTGAPLGADEVAREVLAGIDAGEELILPDPAARAAYELRTTDRAAYDEVMRAQARKLDALAAGVEGGAP